MTILIITNSFRGVIKHLDKPKKTDKPQQNNDVVFQVKYRNQSLSPALFLLGIIYRNKSYYFIEF